MKLLTFEDAFDSWCCIIALLKVCFNHDSFSNFMATTSFYEAHTVPGFPRETQNHVSWKFCRIEHKESSPRH